MLKTRVLTAVVMLLILLPLLFWGTPPLVRVACVIIFAVASWECARLFDYATPSLIAFFWTIVMTGIIWFGELADFMAIWVLSAVLVVCFFIPFLLFGLPRRKSVFNRLTSILYNIALLACFLAIMTFIQQSALYLLSVLSVVWLADTGAYFAGMVWGRHHLAPRISPKKSWEGVIGGWLSVLIVALLVVQFDMFHDTFFMDVAKRWGSSGLIVVLTLLTATSVWGDLIESQLKRHVNLKDSSQLLPGHGGVLDRIDALVFTVPIAALIYSFLMMTS